MDRDSGMRTASVQEPPSDDRLVYAYPNPVSLLWAHGMREALARSVGAFPRQIEIAVDIRAKVNRRRARTNLYSCHHRHELRRR
jgi:hypothetical protein